MIIRGLKSVIAILLVLSAGAAVVRAQDALPEAASGRTSAKSGAAKSYMVVAANPLAAKAGTDILAAGGSAADAAIAVQLVLNMVEPQSSGVGGGAFALYWDAKTEKLSGYDGRETAPAAADENRFLTQDGRPMGRMQAIVGGKSVGVPGVVRLLELLHQKHGRLPWPKLFAPAIEIADDGFAISPRLHALLSGDNSFRAGEPARSYYYNPDGSAKAVGTILRNPEFAKVLRAIAAQGADAFYTGAIAADIVRAVTTATNNPADMTLDDLKNYRALERAPVCGPYRVYKVCGVGPPSSGGVGVIQTLGILEKFDLKGLGAQTPAAEHLLIEAGRLAFADRAVYLADPDKVTVPTATLISPDYIKQRADLVSVDKRMPEAPPGNIPVKGAQYAPAGSPELPATSHFSIIDAAGNALAMTTSVEAQFGSRLMVGGFILNNQLTDFSYQDVAEKRTVANRVEGGKRPRSSMSPTMVFNKNGKVEMVLGSPLGAAIVGLVVKTLVGMIDWNLSPADAAAQPGALFSFGGGVTIEEGLTPAKPALEALGHSVRVGEFASGIHVIRVTKDGLIGGADPRREGVVLGK